MEDSLFSFSERFQPSYKVAPPEYMEQLLVITLLVIIVGGVALALRRYQEGNTASSQSTFTPSYSLVRTSRAERLSTLGTVLLTLVALYFISVLYTLLTLKWGATTREFWQTTWQSAYRAGGLFLLTLPFYALLWYTLCPPQQCRAWFVSYFKLSILFGLAFSLPLLLLLLLHLPKEVIFYTIGGLYLLYRLLVLWQIVVQFPRIRKYPLHFILYLCTCEIGVIYLLYRWGV